MGLVQHGKHICLPFFATYLMKKCFVTRCISLLPFLHRLNKAKYTTTKVENVSFKLKNCGIFTTTCFHRNHVLTFSSDQNMHLPYPVLPFFICAIKSEQSNVVNIHSPTTKITRVYMKKIQVSWTLFSTTHTHTPLFSSISKATTTELLTQ